MQEYYRVINDLIARQKKVLEGREKKVLESEKLEKKFEELETKYNSIFKKKIYELIKE